MFVLRICSLMHTATSELVTDEDWEPVAAVQRVSSPFAISSLPLRFQELMVSALDHLMEYVLFLIVSCAVDIGLAASSVVG